MPDPPVTIAFETSERWRYRCPRGHTAWRPLPSGFYCDSCRRHYEGHASFDRLHDVTTDEWLDREDVEITEG
jgi:hypothetical protein